MTQMDFRSNAGGISLKATFSNGKIINYGAWNDPYVRAFLKDFCLRNCCYDCHAKLAHNDADLTIGDFWGAEKSLPNLMGEDKRLSLVIPQTEKGSVLLQKILPYTMWDTCPIEDGISHNPSIVFSSSKNEKIDIFWKYYCIMPFFKTMNYCEIGGKFEQIRRGLYDRWKSLKSFDFHL